METLTEALQHYADTFNAAAVTLRGRPVKATIDPARIAAPCVLIGPTPAPESLTYDILSGGYTIRVRVQIIVRDNGVPQAMDELGGLAPQVAQVLPVESFTFAQVAAPNHSSNGLPALVAEFETTVT